MEPLRTLFLGFSMEDDFLLFGVPSLILNSHKLPQTHTNLA
jgi:hypothetical protein